MLVGAITVPSSKDPIINRQKAREWRLKNPDRHRESNREWMRKKRSTPDGRERLREISKRSAASRTPEQKASRARYQKAWFDAHPDYSREHQAKDHAVNPTKRMVEAAKVRAIMLGVPFDLDWKTIFIPECCPALGIPLVLGAKGGSSPSVDRLVPALGYVSKNVRIISQSANSIKKNRSIEEMAGYVEKLEFQLLAAKNVLLYMRRELG